jgi:hypothetical protein
VNPYLNTEEDEDVAGTLPGNTEPLPTNPNDLMEMTSAAPPQSHDLLPLKEDDGSEPLINLTPKPNATPTDPAAKLIEDQRIVDENTARAKSEGEDKRAQQAKAHEAALIEAQNHGNELFANAQKRYDDSLKKYEGMQLKDYWDDHSKVAAGIAIAFGALGAAVRSAGRSPGAQNEVLNQIQKDIQNHTEKQKFEIGKMRDQVAMARTGMSDATEAKKALLSDVNAKESAALTSIEAEVRQRLAKQGVPAAQIDADQRVLQLQQARAAVAAKAKELAMKEAESAARVKYLEARTNRANRSGPIGSGAGRKGLSELIAMKESGAKDSEIEARAAKLGIAPKTYLPSLKEVRAGEAGSGKAPTDSQVKSAVYGRAIEDAIKNIDTKSLTPEVLAQYQRNQLASEAADNTAAKGLAAGAAVGAGRALNLVPKSKYDGIPEAAQRSIQQVEVAKESLARIHSGGAIPTAEDRAFADLWAPKSGDSPQLIAQKLQQMKTEGERLLALAGNATKMTEGITNRPAANDNAPKGLTKAQTTALNYMIKTNAPNADAARWALDHQDDPRAADVAAKAIGK